MVKASKGGRRGTRRKLKGHFRRKFKIEPYLKEFKPHERILIRPKTSSHSGFPHARFSGTEGEIVGKRGRSYIVRVIIGNKRKEIITSPEHLERK